MYAQIALPIHTLDWRRVFLDPGRPGNEPLLCIFTDPVYWFARLPERGAFDCFLRIGWADVREVTHLLAVFARLLWKSVHTSKIPPFVCSNCNTCNYVTITT